MRKSTFGESAMHNGIGTIVAMPALYIFVCLPLWPCWSRQSSSLRRLSTHTCQVNRCPRLFEYCRCPDIPAPTLPTQKTNLEWKLTA